MKAFKTLLVLIFAGLLAFSAQGQAKEEAFVNEPGKKIHVFPNPAVDFVNIKFETPVAKTTAITLHDIIGNEIPVESEILDEHELHIKIKDLPTGYYLITVKQEETNQRSIVKFLKR